MIYELGLVNLLLTGFLFIWIPTVVETTTDYTGNTSSWMRTRDSATDEPWDLEQVSNLSAAINIVSLHPKMCITCIIFLQQCARYLIFVEFPRVYVAISNPLFYLTLFITLGGARTRTRKALIEEKQWLFVVIGLVENPRFWLQCQLFFEVHWPLSGKDPVKIKWGHGYGNY